MAAVDSTSSSTITGLSTSGISFAGLATGIDTNSIIQGLTKIAQQNITNLQNQQQDIATKQTAFVTLQADLFDLQSKSSALARSAGSAFDGRTATSSDSTALTAAAGTAAMAGTYTVTVNALAQANQVASQGFADPNAQIKQGTLTLQVGTGTATTVTVDSRNNTLQGLANAINTAGGDVRATVINDGSATPYRLMLSTTKTGAANAIAVTNNLTTGTGADIDPTNTTLQAASDAQVKLGTGPGAIVVNSPTNQVNGLIPGVTLTAVAADPTRPLTLTVAANTAGITQAVQDFVSSYNTAVGFINDQSKFDTSTQTGGLLLGNSTASSLKSDLANALLNVIPGQNAAANRLSSVGLSFNDDGTLALDQNKLSQALSGQTGATIGDLKNLFALSGSSDNPGVAFSFGTDSTKPSGPGGYQVNVTAPATRATVVASGPPAPTITINPPDNTLLMKLNGLTSSGITIPSGDYTPDELVAILQQQINSNAALNGNQVTVGLDPNGNFQITSQQYGSASSVAITGGGAAAALGFTGTESATGTDVAGNFVVNGVTEAATGTGQTLAGNAGNANTDGLRVTSTLTAPGSANLTVNQGLASRLNAVLNSYLDPTNGRLKAVTDGYQSQIDDITKTITKDNDALSEQTQSLQTQFAAMETAVNNLKSIQSQLASLPVLSYGSTSSSSGGL